MGASVGWTIALLAACFGPIDADTEPEGDADGGPPSEDLGDADEDEVDSDERADFLYGAAIVELALEVDDAGVAALLAQTADSLTPDVHATLVYGDERLDVGLHVGGGLSTWSPWDAKPLLKVDVHEWDREALFHGTRRFTLQNQLLDPSRAAERAADRLLVALDAPAPRHGYAHLTVNGADYGLYGVEESLDEQFIDRFWADDEGPLYEADGDLVAGDLGGFRYAERPEVDSDDAELHLLVEDLAGSTADSLTDVLEAHFDLDRLFALWSVELLTGNPSAYTTRARSYGLYWEPTADTWTMVPWGADLAFTADLDVTGIYVGYAYQLCLGAPACRGELRTRLGEAIEIWETLDLPARATEDLDLVAAACAADPRHPAGAAGCEAARARMETFLAGRVETARAQLGLE